MAAEVRSRPDSKTHAYTQRFPWTIPPGYKPRVAVVTHGHRPGSGRRNAPRIVPVFGSGPLTREKHGHSVLCLRRTELRMSSPPFCRSFVLDIKAAFRELAGRRARTPRLVSFGWSCLTSFSVAYVWGSSCAIRCLSGIAVSAPSKVAVVLVHLAGTPCW